MKSYVPFEPSLNARAFLLHDPMAVSLEYLCAGCNQTPHCADWSFKGSLAYGAGEYVALATRNRVRMGLCSGVGGVIHCSITIDKNVPIPNDVLMLSCF